jgi:hypothetical protein
MPQQHQRMSARHPQFKLLALKPTLAEWQGHMQPSPLSDTYIVRVRYVKYKSPRILVVSPTLKLREGAASIPHTYVGNKLCLYYPNCEEWSSDKYIAETIVPWISLWLFYYEGWLATGQWFGGGIEHGNGEKREV